MTPHKRFLGRARRLILFATIASALYGYARFDIVTLPEGALSPLYGIHPGDRMLLDRRAHVGAPGEVWLYRGPDERLLLGRALPAPESLADEARQAMERGALWLAAERDLPGIPDSRQLGPIAREARVGRVLFVFPW